MKQKLTLTVDRGAVLTARRAARRRGSSISALFEQTFSSAPSPDPGFAERWLAERRRQGVREVAPNPADHRFEHLRGKYLKSAK